MRFQAGKDFRFKSRLNYTWVYMVPTQSLLISKLWVWFPLKASCSLCNLLCFKFVSLQFDLYSIYLILVFVYYWNSWNPTYPLIQYDRKWINRLPLKWYFICITGYVWICSNDISYVLQGMYESTTVQ
jgi:hypothetical protein